MFKVINVCLKYNVTLFNVTTFKDKLKRRDPEWLYPACLHIVTRVYHKYLEKKGSTGLLVMDARGAAQDDMATYMQSSYLLWGKDGKKNDRVMNLPFFTPSHLSIPLQILSVVRKEGYMHG